MEKYTEQNFKLVTLHFKASLVMLTSCFYKSTKTLPILCRSFNLKTTGTSCTDDARVKVSSFQKVTFFLQYEIILRVAIHLNFCLFEDVSDCRH